MEKGKVSTTARAVAGFASFGLGAIGAVIPIFANTTPFLLVDCVLLRAARASSTSGFAARDSTARFSRATFPNGAMTPAAKLKVIIPVTIVLGVSFALMASAPVGRAVIGAVWLAHLPLFRLDCQNRPGLAGKRRVERRVSLGACPLPFHPALRPRPAHRSPAPIGAYEFLFPKLYFFRACRTMRKVICF